MAYLSPVGVSSPKSLVQRTTGRWATRRLPPAPRPATGSSWQRWTLSTLAMAATGRRGQKVMRRALGSSPWEILGVAPGATPAEIKKAYRRKALKEHPDVSKLPDAKQRWQELSAAYDALNDPEKLKSWQRAQSGASSSRRTRSGGGYRSDGRWSKTQQMEEEYDTGGDSFGAIFSDFFDTLADTATGPESRVRRATRAGGMLLEDLLEFLEKGLGEDAANRSTSRSSSPFEGSNPEAELQEAQLEFKTMQSRDEVLAAEANAWERKSELCRAGGDKAGELDAMQRLFDTRERRKTIRRRLLSIQERKEYLEKVLFEYKRKQEAKAAGDSSGSTARGSAAGRARANARANAASAGPSFDADQALAELKRSKGKR